MRFKLHKRRNPPTVIIVALIDVLMVVLIFLMVASTFKQQPSLRLALPQSSQAQTTADAGDTLVVTIGKQQPHFFLGQLPVTYEKLQSELLASAKRNAQLRLAIRADTEAPFGEVVRVMDAAKEAGIKTVNAQTRTSGSP
jgi:biopolymer transport protein ExbD